MAALVLAPAVDSLWASHGLCNSFLHCCHGGDFHSLGKFAVPVVSSLSIGHAPRFYLFPVVQVADIDSDPRRNYRQCSGEGFAPATELPFVFMGGVPDRDHAVSVDSLLAFLVEALF